MHEEINQEDLRRLVNHLGVAGALGKVLEIAEEGEPSLLKIEAEQVRAVIGPSAERLGE